MKTKKNKTKVKRNPQDLTLRNLRALKKRVEDLEEAHSNLVWSLLAYGILPSYSKAKKGKKRR